jgi:hypothetical protein
MIFVAAAFGMLLVSLAAVLIQFATLLRLSLSRHFVPNSGLLSSPNPDWADAGGSAL